ncbi:hypothetical protein HMPREF0650_1262 [Hoylesella buccalis ATCC 35310]|uniref:Uncharacterized protein n=1 Tax=Hoylesella buccalis ATCC 35310 TaxID=679190 RepID=D1W468_9BACT|nr:hypothetical protein HMPREF0650_1262 [Hoylesella buccalis ATCC 35310]
MLVRSVYATAAISLAVVSTIKLSSPQHIYEYASHIIRCVIVWFFSTSQ